jgi:hypothetical protein
MQEELLAVIHLSAGRFRPAQMSGRNHPSLFSKLSSLFSDAQVSLPQVDGTGKRDGEKSPPTADPGEAYKRRSEAYEIRKVMTDIC